MRKFSPETVNTAFERQSGGTLKAMHEDLGGRGFRTYEDFEKHQMVVRRPVWIEALLKLSNCKRRDYLEIQYDFFADVFRSCYRDHFKRLTAPSPDSFPQFGCEFALTNFVVASLIARRCGWTREHEFNCFCDEHR